MPSTLNLLAFLAPLVAQVAAESTPASTTSLLIPDLDGFALAASAQATVLSADASTILWSLACGDIGPATCRIPPSFTLTADTGAASTGHEFYTHTNATVTTTMSCTYAPTTAGDHHAPTGAWVSTRCDASIVGGSAAGGYRADGLGGLANVQIVEGLEKLMVSATPTPTTSQMQTQSSLQSQSQSQSQSTAAAPLNATSSGAAGAGRPTAGVAFGLGGIGGVVVGAALAVAAL